MQESKPNKLSTESYKGVRDFYPADMAIQNKIFGIWKKSVESFGYEEYNASVLESSDLYRAKSGEEIVNEETYSFTDRGGRDVTLRPEMTPTVARMVAAKKRELSFPLRWYSIPNLFRYQQPQRGRLREHWQLNVDIFGVKTIDAEVEVISVAHSIMLNCGLKANDFEIRINSRKIMNYILRHLYNLSDDAAYKVSKLIDKKAKISSEDFEKGVTEFLHERAHNFVAVMNSQNFEELVSHLHDKTEVADALKEVHDLLGKLEKLGITNAFFDQTVMRGFDYYTGVVFEIFDKNPLNRRALFGGGRYDDLLSIFGSEKIPAVGFGMGDVTLRDVLETYNLLETYSPKSELYVCIADDSAIDYAQEFAQKLRSAGVSVALDLTGKKIGDQIRYADKNNIPFVACIGEAEMTSDTLRIKDLKAGKEEEFNIDDTDIADFIKNSISLNKLTK